MGELILVLGGARSGKTTFAQQLGRELGGENVLFVATAEARDDEMAARIASHRQSRPASWCTLEAPLDVAAVLAQQADAARVVLIDCLSLLVSNVILALGEEPDAAAAQAAVMSEVEGILRVQRAATAAFIIVSNEVGLGLVPPYPLGRLYRDLLGLANQAVAAQASRVYLMVAGIPLDLRALARSG